jgi:allophanate hydrolase subunit 2
MFCYRGQNEPDRDRIRFVPGPQFAFFSEEVQTVFESADFRISPMSDRMGIRLDGPALRSEKAHDILSEGVVAGSVQVPGSGNPIVLGRDCQTTGGYPKIATIISADLDQLFQIPTGQIVRFAAVTAEDAFKAARKAANWRTSLRSAMQPAQSVPEDLSSHNLIGGVTKGDEI